MYCLKRGPLLFSLPIPAEAKIREYTSKDVPRVFPFCDYEFFPRGKWNWAFASEHFTVEEHPLPGAPFSRTCPPVTIKGRFAEIDWPTFENNPVCAAATPRSRAPLGPAAEKELVPYGCTVLRMTEMPLVTAGGNENE